MTRHPTTHTDPPAPGAPRKRYRLAGYDRDRTTILEAWIEARYAWITIAELDRSAIDARGNRRPRWRRVEAEPLSAEPIFDSDPDL